MEGPLGKKNCSWKRGRSKCGPESASSVGAELLLLVSVAILYLAHGALRRALCALQGALRAIALEGRFGGAHLRRTAELAAAEAFDPEPDGGDEQQDADDFAHDLNLCPAYRLIAPVE